MPNLGPMEIAIIALVVLVLFGGAKLAGLGKSTGRALREFKEETKSLKDDKDEATDSAKGSDARPSTGDEASSDRTDSTPEITRGPAGDTSEADQQQARREGD